ncbi:MAG: hypothetical protein KatS3mg052_1158 [Candidatus Roseilinea sp.]|nr:MAG: hypothetical protein KatS3mg052_1158 [Candidatus Roseilinea sp.]
MDRVLVLPGDLIIADDDGAVCVPQQMAPVILEHALHHWEVRPTERRGPEGVRGLEGRRQVNVGAGFTPAAPQHERWP